LALRGKISCAPAGDGVGGGAVRAEVVGTAHADRLSHGTAVKEDGVWGGGAAAAAPRRSSPIRRPLQLAKLQHRGGTADGVTPALRRWSTPSRFMASTSAFGTPAPSAPKFIGSRR
jgi:hypothetical protein